jgi:hypothetical protein
MWSSLQGRPSLQVNESEFRALVEQLTSLDICTSQICERELSLQSAYAIPLEYCELYTRETIQLISQAFHVLSSTLPSSYITPLSSLLTQSLHNQWKVHRTFSNGEDLLQFLQHLLSTLDPNPDEPTRLLELHNTRYRLAATALDMSFLYGQHELFQSAKEVVELGLSVSSDWISSAYLESPSPAPQFIYIHLSLLGYYGQYLLLSPSRSLPHDAELAVNSARKSMHISYSVYRQIHVEKMTFCEKTLDIHISGLLVVQGEEEKREVYQRILEIVKECNIVLGGKRQLALENAMSGGGR